MAGRFVHIGVDVGGTNSDAVVMHAGKVMSSAKCLTTADVTSGVSLAVATALRDAAEKAGEPLQVQRVHIGTTHFVNAVVQQRQLARVAVVRLCGPASTALPPFIDFPQDLAQKVNGAVYQLEGGYHFDGREITSVKKEEILKTIEDLKKKNIRNIVVSGVFSPTDNSQEELVGQLIAEHYEGASVTLSHRIAQLNLLLRENAAILNEALKPLARSTVAAFRQALDDLHLTCPFFLTQNDGTLISAAQTLETPVYTFASGTTNSMRGAAFLSNIKDAVVADLGGTSTDVGMLIGGFPRLAAAKVKVGNVQTNFRMPDVVSIGLGGGSLVSQHKTGVRVGPQSVGYRLPQEALVFGGSVLTASDVAVAAGLASMGEHEDVVKALEPGLAARAVQRMRAMLEDLVDQIKTSAEAVPLILVGGGSVLIDSSAPLAGTSRTEIPRHFDVANAVGAALSQVSGSVDTLEDLSGQSRDEAIAKAKARAEEKALEAGAAPGSVKIQDCMEVPIAYVPGNATRICVKAVGDLDLSQGASSQDACPWVGAPAELWEKEVQGVSQEASSTGQSLETDPEAEQLSSAEREPTINEAGEWELSEWDIECLAVGAGILGCGGGGNPHNGKLRALKTLREGKTIRVITPERFIAREQRDSMAVPYAGMGAPTIGVEILGDVPTESLFAHHKQQASSSSIPCNVICT